MTVSFCGGPLLADIFRRELLTHSALATVESKRFHTLLKINTISVDSWTEVMRIAIRF